MHRTLAWHKSCQPNEARLDRGWGSGALARLRPALVLARSREGAPAHAHAHAAASVPRRVGPVRREVSRDRSPGMTLGRRGVVSGKGGEPGQRPGSLASGRLGGREGGWQRECVGAAACLRREEGSRLPAPFAGRER